MRLIFLGPPGAGKGTQSSRICDEYNLKVLSTGDILRKNRDTGTILGEKARDYMQRGELVPDDLIIDMIKLELKNFSDEDGFILDGFPRTVAQAEALDKLLIEMNSTLDSVLVLDVPNESIIQRISGRRMCRTCGRSFHNVNNPPPPGPECERGICDLFQRIDDTEATVKNRLAVYQKQTHPLVAYYEKTGLAYHVDGFGSMDDVYDRIKSALNKINS